MRSSVDKTFASNGRTLRGMCTTVKTGQTMTTPISTVRPPDSRLGGPINEQAEAERRANSKGSLGMLVEVTKGGDGELRGSWILNTAGRSEAETKGALQCGQA